MLVCIRTETEAGLLSIVFDRDRESVYVTPGEKKNGDWFRLKRILSCVCFLFFMCVYVYACAGALFASWWLCFPVDSFVCVSYVSESLYTYIHIYVYM